MQTRQWRAIFAYNGCHTSGNGFKEQLLAHPFYHLAFLTCKLPPLFTISVVSEHSFFWDCSCFFSGYDKKSTRPVCYGHICSCTPSYLHVHSGKARSQSQFTPTPCPSKSGRVHIPLCWGRRRMQLVSKFISEVCKFWSHEGWSKSCIWQWQLHWALHHWAAGVSLQLQSAFHIKHICSKKSPGIL